MLEMIRKKQPNFYQQAILPISNGKVSHAYFIETNDVISDKVEMYLSDFIYYLFQQKEMNISKEKLKHLLETKSYPDLIDIYPINNTIKKEQLLMVMEQFKNKSIYDNYQIYVVHEANKLNAAAANTILKFLEEPALNIIAILIGSNRYQVINTVLSRCQLLTLKHETDELDIKMFSDIEISFFENICSRSQMLMIFYNSYYENLFKTKELAIQTLNHANIYLKSKFETEISADCEIQSDNTINLFSLLILIEIIEKSLAKLKYNVNLKLWLDELLLQLMEVSYENS